MILEFGTKSLTLPAGTQLGGMRLRVMKEGVDAPVAEAIIDAFQPVDSHVFQIAVTPGRYFGTAERLMADGSPLAGTLVVSTDPFVVAEPQTIEVSVPAWVILKP